uniref:Phospholipid metabolism enzyme regulator n=1 Tax=Coccidioides posadasii RMSCC 3488 TaxID=454284 RepID=A0A0J6EYJ6_COCPO|nr:hypothetical protein CPAG_01977 [Coccidioides posadasii RMSCC 3488]
MSNQRNPDWEMPSPATTRNGKRGQGRPSSDLQAPPSTRDVQSNGTTQLSKYLSTGQHAPLSSTSSVTSSREASPNRVPPRSVNPISASRTTPRSRRNSQELGPSRNSSSTSINRTHLPAARDLESYLVDSNKPHLPPPTTDASTDLSQPNKSNMPTKSGDPPLQWPKFHRIKSPPPGLPARIPLQRTISPRRADHDNISANTASKRHPAGSDNILSADKCLEAPEDAQFQNPTRGVGRGTAPVLETVQEGTVPGLTAIDPPTGEDPGEAAKVVKPSGDSGSDSGGNKSAGSKTDNIQKHGPTKPRSDEVLAKRSFTSLNSVRGKIGESSMTNMTVETETVSSIPQVSLGGGAGERGGLGRKDGSATVRLRASDETIRPRKEKKKTRKPTLPTGTASSKADIFEAKVASAVEDADSSDSAETFVYESNPPDPHPSRQHRYHSRTPSAASAVGQLDQYGNRMRPGVRDSLHGITGKRSMKFTNTSYNTMDGEGEDRSAGRGTSRGHGLHTARHYHIGRHGRNGAHQGALDQSAFQPSQNPKSSRHFLGNGRSRKLKKDGDTYGYDFDAEGADDERTPLVGAIRGIRGRHGRRSNGSSLRQMEYLGQRRIGFWARYGVCALLLMLFFVLTSGSTLFIIGATQPLKNVRVREIQNVLASEQTIMLDLDIEAVNPNLFALTIDDMDVNIFAKSRYVGSDSFWRDRGPHPKKLPRTTESKKRAINARNLESSKRGHSSKDLASIATVNVTGGVDKGTDPMPDDDVRDPQTMLLGRIFHFASPLTFEPSPWKHIASNSTGQVRLTKPGNKTEEGGSLRWERVLQHPFELIVRGVVKYQLPLSSGTKSASISSKINVLPDEDSNGDKDGDADDSRDHDGHTPDDSVHIE